MLAEPYLSNFRTKTEEFEGRTTFMYLDTGGNVTAGVGHEIPTVQDAEALPFDGGMGAVAGTVARDWQTIRDAPAGRVAAFYEPLTTSRLSEQAIDGIFASDCNLVWTSARGFIQDFDNLPQPVQQAISDMILNIGAEKEHADYFGPHSKFGPAIERGDWVTAAKESARNGIPESRNQYTANLILSAMQPIT
jgi:GH24 family phage-related lysozyme (muramidase)